MTIEDAIMEFLFLDDELLGILDSKELSLTIKEAEGTGSIRIGNPDQEIGLAVFVNSTNYKWFNLGNGLKPFEERFLSVSEYNRYTDFIDRSLKALGYTRR